MLRTSGLTKRFGGLVAVDSVDLEIEADELCSLIGPNGAGKTTFFNLLTGALTPTAGRIELERDGTVIDLTETSPDETARFGIHRSYQITNIFPQTSVLENVRVAAQAHSRDSMKLWRNVGRFDRHYETAWTVLERVGLAEQAHLPAANLSHGQKRQLEVAIALPGDPVLLLLDEPTAGVSTEGVDAIIELIEDVAADHAVLLVEHNMELVMEVSDRIVVLHQGERIADGPPDAVRSDPTVQEAYLGGYGADDATA